MRIGGAADFGCGGGGESAAGDQKLAFLAQDKGDGIQGFGAGGGCGAENFLTIVLAFWA